MFFLQISNTIFKNGMSLSVRDKSENRFFEQRKKDYSE